MQFSIKLARMKLTMMLAGAALIAVSASAGAASLLYRNDYNLGTDYLGNAISASSYSVTTTSSDLSAFTLSSFDVVVYANQNTSVPGGDLARLNLYVSGGGRVIFNDWTGNAFGGASVTGNSNLGTLTVGAQFNAGIAGPLAVINPGWGTFSLGLAGGTTAGTFENGDSAIVIGNSGRTIYNGFLSDTVASERLYANELASFSAAAPVPEPETYAMLLAGLGLMGFIGRRRKQQTA